MWGLDIHAKKCKRFDAEADAHMLTFCCLRDQRFLNARSCEWLISTIDRARSKLGFHVWAHVFMPEHVHLVLWPRQARTSRILASIKLPVSQTAVRWVKQYLPEHLPKMADAGCYRFWRRGGGFDRNLRSDHDVHEKIRYVHENPLRRKLVSRLEDWPWSSWHVYQGRTGPLTLDLESLPVVLT